MADEKGDDELTAIRTALGALIPLSESARSRVIQYIMARFALKPPIDSQASSTLTEGANAGKPALDPAPRPPHNRAAGDIREFVSEKQPKSGIEMAAVMAYYLANVAPADERKGAVIADNIHTYYVQAGFPLPAKPRQCLVDAKNVGWLVPTGNRGEYKLTPVGNNLVAHRLPESSDTVRRRRAKRTPRVPTESATPRPT